MATVVAVSASGVHGFSKAVRTTITLLTGLGVAEDTHRGITVQHRSRVARDPAQANLRQVHLLQRELLEELSERGFQVTAGDIGENVLTAGNLLSLGRGTLLRLGDAAVVEVTGLRNPCRQLDDFMPGLMAATLGRDPAGGIVRKAGVMAVVRDGGVVRPGDTIVIEPPAVHLRLEPV